MKILVAIRSVIDNNTVLRFKSDGSIDTNNIKLIINPYDEIALEEAIRIRELGIADEVIVVSVGDIKTKKNIINCLAMGADRAIFIENDYEYDEKFANQESNIEPINNAKIIKYFAELEKVKIILIGKQSIDNENTQVGQMTSALLGWSQATFASAIVFEEKTEENPEPNFAIVAREVDSGSETIKVKLPTVITADLRLNTPRFISISNLLKAKKKPIEKISLTELANNLNIDLRNRMKIINIKPTPKRKEGRELSSVQELAKILKGRTDA